MKKFTWSDLIHLKEVRTFLTGFVLLSAGVVFMTTTVAFLLTHDFWKKEYTLYAVFGDGTGLSKGAKVLLNGVEIGAIRRVRLEPAQNGTGRVVVTLGILHDYHGLIRSNSVIYAKRDKNVVSDRALNIELGDPGQPELAAGDTLATAPSQDLESALIGLNELTIQFKSTLNRVDSVLHLVTDTNTTLGALLVKDELYKKTLRTLEGIDRTTEAAGTVVGRLDRVGAGVERDLPRLLSRVDTMTIVLTGTVGRADSLARGGLALIRRGEGIADDADQIADRTNDVLDRSDRLLQGVSDVWFLRGKVKPLRNPEDRLPLGPVP